MRQKRDGSSAVKKALELTCVFIPEQMHKTETKSSPGGLGVGLYGLCYETQSADLPKFYNMAKLILRYHERLNLQHRKM